MSKSAHFLSMPGGVGVMALLLNDSTDWELQALDTRHLADREPDPAIKAWLMNLASEYERLARRAGEPPMRTNERNLSA